MLAMALPAFEVLLFASIAVERILLRNNPMATVRRLAVASSLASLLWLLVILLGFTSPSKRQSFFLTGMFVATAFNFLVLASVFVSRFAGALLLSFLHPLSAGVLLEPTVFQNPSQHVDAFTGGIIVLTALLLYLRAVDRSGRQFLGTSSLRFFRAFLRSWVSDHPDEIETLLERNSIPDTVTTNMLYLKNGGSPVVLVIPGVHPGPMHPIGSSDLPSQLFTHLSRRGWIPFIFHGISNHELNLPSRGMVEHYLASVGPTDLGPSVSSCSEPSTISKGKATVTGISFGDIALMTLTLSPNGMEDFPRTVSQRITNHATHLGYKRTIIIDAHNSLGTVPTEEDCTDAVQASQQLLVQLKASPQYPFKVGHAHSSALHLDLGDEIGPAGLGAIIIQVHEIKCALIASDSNNAAPGLREQILERYRSTPVKILEFCTSDTHFSAGKVMNVKGYSPLGAKTPLIQLTAALDTILEEAVKTLHPSVATSSSVTTELKVFGPHTLERFSKALDHVLNVAKKGGVILIAVVMIVLTILLTR